ncbi:MAG TPA: dihydrodipicolinate synthase family protein [Terrimicrobiaceae bacterium]
MKHFGLSCALALPLKEGFEIDYRRLVVHAQRCLDAGCSSVTVFGTTGEGASVSLIEREKVLDALLGVGLNLKHKVIGGITATSLGDAVAQAQMIVDSGCRGMLVAPPFYFKKVTEEGLYAWFSQFFEKVALRGCDVILYHIPSVTETPLSLKLISQLKTAYPDIVKGVKDSGADWSYTEKLLGMDSELLTLIGNERHLAAGVRLGAQGSISGLANLCPEILLELIDSGVDDPRVGELVLEILKFPVTAAVKALLAHRDKDPAWSKVRPPLVSLAPSEMAQLGNCYDRIFS